MNPDRKRTLVFILVWLVAGFLQLPLMAPFFFPNSHYLEDHLILSSLLYLISAILIFWSVPQRHSLFLFPFMGWIMALLSVMNGTKEKENAPENEIPEELFIPFSLTALTETSRVSQKKRILKEIDLLSLAEVLAGHDIDLIRGAMSRLGEIKTPEAIVLLLQQQLSPSADIRFLATATLTRIKREFEEELESARQEMKKDVAKISARFFMAKRYLAFVQSHLLDQETSSIYRSEAMNHLRFVVQSPTASLEAFWILIDATLEQEQWNESLEVLGLLEKKGGGDPLEIEKRRCLVYYRTRQIRLFLAHIPKLKALGMQDNVWLAALNWWGITT